MKFDGTVYLSLLINSVPLAPHEQMYLSIFMKTDF